MAEGFEEFEELEEYGQEAAEEVLERRKVSVGGCQEYHEGDLEKALEE